MHTCPVCGFPELSEPPRTAEGGGSYEICPSCGFQFGVTDEDRGFTYARWRRQWIAGGMKWSSERPQPAGWSPRPPLKKRQSKGSKPRVNGRRD